MIHSGVRQALRSLKPSEYIGIQRQTGRSGLSPEFVRQWADQYNSSGSLLNSSRLKPELAETMRFIREITYPMAMQAVSSIPYYYPYTCVNILDWYMGDCDEDPEKLKRKSILGIVALLLDLGKFEMHSLIGCEPFQPLHFEPELALERIRILKDVYAATARLSGLVPGSSAALPYTSRSYESVLDYASEPGRISALIYFTCLPQTQYHDEVLFLRSIHISELCFYGIRNAIAQAKDEIRRSAFTAARTYLQQAIAFTEVLREIFKVVRTMPVEHFLDFRASAANASAVQSANYQLLEIHLFGFNEHKRALFERIPHLQGMVNYSQSSFVCLRDLLSSVSPNSNDAEAASLLETARQLDSRLLTWRGLHVSFAQLYLADISVGTGGTSGAAYLKLFLRNTLFGETKANLEMVEESSEAPPPDSGLHIAPPKELIGPEKIIIPEPIE
jgi:tryptophan 2,3-dioxygenase